MESIGNGFGLPEILAIGGILAALVLVFFLGRGKGG